MICLVGSAVFSASETALMTLSKIRVKQMIQDGVKGSERVGKLMDDPNKLLSAILIGNNIVNIGASSLMTSLAIDAFGSKGVGFATGLMTLLILVFGEITPKTLAANNADKIALKLSRFIEIVSFFLTPFIFILSMVTKFIVKLFGGDLDETHPFITQDELRSIVSVSHSEGILEGDERDMIHNVFDFSDAQVHDVMINRAEMIAVDVDSTYEEVLEVIRNEQFSRIPVYEKTPDNVVGILYVKDLLHLSAENIQNFDLKAIYREPHFTYEFKLTKDLFNEMRNNRIHMMIVLDEYGGTEGIITLEDLIEEIVGEIEDEYDSVEDDIIVVKENEYIVSGNVKLEVINDQIGTHLESEEFDTIAGYVIGLNNKIPELGETIEYENIKFIIEEIDRNKIQKIRIIN